MAKCIGSLAVDVSTVGMDQYRHFLQRKAKSFDRLNYIIDMLLDAQKDEEWGIGGDLEEAKKILLELGDINAN